MEIISNHADNNSQLSKSPSRKPHKLAPITDMKPLNDSSTISISSSNKTFRQVTAEKKLNDINQKLKEIREQKEQLQKEQDAIMHLPHRVQLPKIKYRPKSPPKGLHHSKLEYVVAEMTMSPYLIDPLKPYPYVKKMNKIRELKMKGVKYKDIPQNEKPFEFEKCKRTFKQDVLKSNEVYFPDDDLAQAARSVMEVVRRESELSRISFSSKPDRNTNMRKQPSVSTLSEDPTFLTTDGDDGSEEEKLTGTTNES